MNKYTTNGTTAYLDLAEAIRQEKERQDQIRKEREARERKAVQAKREREAAFAQAFIRWLKEMEGVCTRPENWVIHEHEGIRPGDHLYAVRLRHAADVRVRCFLRLQDGHVRTAGEVDKLWIGVARGGATIHTDSLVQACVTAGVAPEDLTDDVPF